MSLIFFLLFEFYVTLACLVDGRFPVKTLIFTIGVIVKFLRENIVLWRWNVKSLFKSRLMHMPVATSARKVRESNDISSISAH